MIRPALIILLLLALAGCATPEPERVEVFRAPPSALMNCQASPAVPDAQTQADVARYIVRLHAAGSDCRSKLNAVRSWADAQSKIDTE